MAANSPLNPHGDRPPYIKEMISLLVSVYLKPEAVAHIASSTLDRHVSNEQVRLRGRHV